MPNLSQLTTRFARRPLLIEPNAASQLVQHLALGDPRGMRSESRLDAVLRKIGLGRKPQPTAMHDDDGDEVSRPTGPVCYAPLWAEQRFGDPTDTGFGWSLFNGVAMMEVATALSDRGEYYCGEFYHGYDTVLAAMREASADERVKGLFVRMMCPGGPVAGGLAQLAAFMRANRAAAGGKPIHIFCDMACSAAYWIAAQADHLSAPRVGLVGSIGAVIVHEDWSDALAKMGVTMTAIQFGSGKTDGAFWAQLSPSAKADLQSEIDQCGADFVADVALGRPKLTPAALIATQARVFMAHNDDAERSGIALGFVDAIESEEQAFDRLLNAVNTSATSSAPQILPANGPTAQTPKKETTPMAMAPKTTPKASTETAAEGEAAPVVTADGGDDDDCPDCDGTGVVDGEPCATCQGTGKMDDPNAAAEVTEPSGEPAADAAAEARAISASPEAAANPAMALAAINSGATLGQFKAMAAAPVGKARPGALAAAMSQNKALGADTATGAAQSLGAMLVADAKSRNPNKPS